MIRAVIHSLLGAAAVVTTASIASWRGLPALRPAPVAWILVAVLLPAPLAVAGIISRRLHRTDRDLSREVSRRIPGLTTALVAIGHAAILLPLGGAACILDGLGWRAWPAGALAGLLLPAVALRIWMAPWRRASLRLAGGADAGATGAIRRTAVAAAGLLLLVGPALAVATLGGPERIADAYPTASIGLLALGVGAVFVAAPWLVRWFLDTAPLPPEVEIRAMEVARRHGARPGSMRRWDDGAPGRPAALTAGVVPGTQVVLLSADLVDRPWTETSEAVLCHELGHLRRHHGALNLLLVASLVLVLAALVGAGPPDPPGAIDVAVWAAACALGLLVSLRVSRRLELEADAEAATILGPGRYAEALRDIARRIGPVAGRRGWRHPSIEERIARVEDLGRRAVGDRGARRALRRPQVAVLGVVLAAGTAYAWRAALEATRPREAILEELAEADLSLAEEVRPAAIGLPDARGRPVPRWLAWARAPEERLEARYRRLLEDAAARLVEAGTRGRTPSTGALLARTRDLLHELDAN